MIALESTPRGSRAQLTMKPSDINSELNHTGIQKGMLLWGAVNEKSDHCYQLDAGIKNCRIVLPFKSVDKDTDYGNYPLKFTLYLQVLLILKLFYVAVVGQLVWFVVTKCEISKEAATITVSTKSKDVSNNLAPDTLPFHYLMPGTQVEFKVKRVLKDGLQGKIFNFENAYIHNLFLEKPLSSVGQYNEGDELTARILYIQPLSKFVFLSLQSFNFDETLHLKIGDILLASVSFVCVC